MTARTTLATTQLMELIHLKAEALIDLAISEGVVLTIETKAREPLAMGNYDIVVETRLARWRAALTD
jgi:hypothetical protein